MLALGVFSVNQLKFLLDQVLSLPLYIVLTDYRNTVTYLFSSLVSKDEPGQNFNHNYRRSSARFQKRRKRLKLYFLTWRFIFNFKHVFVIKKMILFFLIVRMYYRASGMLSTSSILIFMEKYSK